MEFPDPCKTIGSVGHIPFAGCIYSRETKLPIASGEMQEVASLLGTRWYGSIHLLVVLNKQPMKPGLHRHDTAQNLVFGVKAAGYRRKQPKGVDIAALKFLAAISKSPGQAYLDGNMGIKIQ